MLTVRALFRILLIALVTTALTVLWQLGHVLLWRRTARQQLWRGWIVRNWAKAMLGILRTRVTVQGTPPQPPYCLVSNHLSYYDIIVYLSVMPCVFIAKAEVQSWPVMGKLAKMAGTVFIDRGRKRDVVRINAWLTDALAQGEGVVFFPEGTSTKGETVLRFKAPLLAPLVESAEPVYVGAISYQTPPHSPPAHLLVAWWGDMTFGDHFFNLMKHSGVQATLSFGDQTYIHADRKVLADHLQAAVQRLFVPLVEEPPPTALTVA